jgi:hypothetical protein
MGAFGQHRSEGFCIYSNQDQRIRKTKHRYDDRHTTTKPLKFGSIQEIMPLTIVA